MTWKRATTHLFSGILAERALMKYPKHFCIAFIKIMSAANGAKLFKAKCATCHTCNEGGPNKQGPNLYGVIGRKSGQVAGFKYTQANVNSAITWSVKTMEEYLQNPKKYIKGTNMAFPGFKKETDRRDVALYLDTMR